MKKFITLGLMSAMIISPISGLAFSDISESPYKSEIEFFEKEGIVNGKGDGKFYPDDKLTRAETAKICAGILPDTYFQETRLVFSDVLFNHWGVKEIGNTSLVINALTPEYAGRFPEEHSQRLFYPDKATTVEYLLDVCLEMLGYSSMKEEPEIGYEDTLGKAKESGILDGIVLKEGQKMTREEGMKIFYNTINAPIVLTEGLTYNAELGKFITNVKVMDGSSEDTPYKSLWMYKNK